MKTPKLNAPPPPKRASRLGLVHSAPFSAEGLNNLAKSAETEMQDMNFKVDPAFHRRFKLEATLRNLSMKDLLESCFKCYLETHGGSMEKPKSELI